MASDSFWSLAVADSIWEEKSWLRRCSSELSSCTNPSPAGVGMLPNASPATGVAGTTPAGVPVGVPGVVAASSAARMWEAAEAGPGGG
eukprot:8719664-Pyramimonas_sp.AAC.1